MQLDKPKQQPNNQETVEHTLTTSSSNRNRQKEIPPTENEIPSLQQN